jgi:hypothetical protein
MSKGLDTD